jgi:hypothetical protein
MIRRSFRNGKVQSGRIKRQQDFNPVGRNNPWGIFMSEKGTVLIFSKQII